MYHIFYSIFTFSGILHFLPDEVACTAYNSFQLSCDTLSGGKATVLGVDTQCIIQILEWNKNRGPAGSNRQIL